MKTLYLECGMGAAGDMLMAALLELCEDRQGFLDRLNAIGIPGVVVTAEPSVKCGITGTRVRVAVGGHEEECHTHDHDGHGHHTHDDTHRHTHHHTHNDYDTVEQLINRLTVSDAVKQNSLGIYKLIADAESHAHGVPVDKIHFHEVGEMDAVADIVGVCMLLEDIAPDVIMASPVNVGGGHVHCAHGILPVPAPATAHILRGVVMYGDSSSGELCTPTGAAILKHFAKEFRDMPVMSVNKIGYGMGKKDCRQANCVRAYIGDACEGDNDINDEVTESVTLLSCNLDDMTPEAVAFAQELLLQNGALDAWTSPVVMKKGRLGVLFCCLCRNDVRQKMIALIFEHTTTLGIRESIVNRYTLNRDRSEVQTPHGSIRIKTAQGFGVKKSKLEYEDIAAIAREKNTSLRDIVASVG